MTPKCVLEVRELQCQARELLARGTPRDVAKATEVRKMYEAVERRGFSTDEARERYVSALVESTSGPKRESEERYRKAFSSYIFGGGDAELRDIFAGTQSIAYTEGAAGGYMVPDATDETLYTACAQVDPALDRNVTSFSMTPTATLQPSQISGYDLSSITASIVGETVEQNAQAFPPVAGAVLRSDVTFRASFAASLEASQDVPNFTEKIIRAGATALARKIGQSVLDGRGGTDMSGITQNLSASLNNGTTGKISLTDITNFYFGVNRFYRAAAKCAWLVGDGVYKFIRNAVDSQNRPLLSVERDGETLMGRPIYISPSLARAYSSIGLQGALIFGDLSHLIVRASRPTVQVCIEQAVHGIEFGECVYVFRQRADAAYFDPSAGVTPPIVMAAIS